MFCGFLFFGEEEGKGRTEERTDFVLRVAVLRHGVFPAHSYFDVAAVFGISLDGWSWAVRVS